MLFESLLAAGFLLCLTSSFVVLGAINRQREEGTLGLLFLTPVKPGEVLFGAFGSSGIGGFCNLLALAPVVVVPLLAGGVTMGEIVRSVVVLLDAMGLSLAIGVWAASRGKEWWRSVRIAALLLVAIVFVPLFALTSRDPVAAQFAAASPIRTLVLGEDAWYLHSPFEFWRSVAFGAAVSWLLLWWSAASFRNFRDLQPREKPLPARHRRGRRPVGRDPVRWLLRRQGDLTAFVWLIMLLSMGFDNRFAWLRFARMGFLGFGRFFNWLNGIGLAIAIVRIAFTAWAGARFFVEARRRSELELLLTTPVRATDLVRGQWRFLREIFLLPTLIWMTPFALGGAMVLWTRIVSLSATWHAYGNGDMSDLTYLVATVVCFNIARLAEVAAELWVGMWLGYATGSAIKSVLAVTGMMIIVSSLNIIAPQRSGPPQVSSSLFVFLFMYSWPFLKVLYPILLIRWARRRLLEELEGRSTPRQFPFGGLLYRDIFTQKCS
jgi:hypothetical protein